MAKDPTTKTSPIYFDLETGGFWSTSQQSLHAQAAEGAGSAVPRPSSILSISSSHQGVGVSSFSNPTPGSWVSRFSEQNILPQLQGKALVSEEDSIKQFIGRLRENPTAPIAGYNIAGFDMEFLQGRARQYGLGDEFKRLAESRQTIDVGFEARDLIAGAVNQQISDGVFNTQLGGRTFASLEMEYFGPGGRRAGVAPAVPFADQNPNFKILSQVRGFARHGYQGRVEGWKLAPTFQAYSKWAGIEDTLSSAAHESMADVKMTQILHEAVESGRFSQFVDRPEFGPSWLQMVHEQRAAGAAVPKGAGSFWREAAEAAVRTPSPEAPVPPSIWQRSGLPTGRELKVLGGVGAALLGAGAIYSMFSGYDDSYNTIEGLNHGGIAEQSRKTFTDFGSGYTGLPVDSEIMDFREEVLLDKEKKAELKEELKRLEREAQEEVGSFTDSQFLEGSAVYAGMNAKRQDLQRINLDRFNINVEDADSLVLSHRGFFSGMFKNDILVRLAGVDAPEVGGHGVDPLEDIRWRQDQAGGSAATEELRQRLAEADDLDLVVAAKGKTYGRYLGAVIADGQNVNIELARSGAVSALPFGKVEQDIVDRSAVGRAERQAQAEGAGIHQMARYKAIDIATEAAGRDITYNTTTRLDKLGEDLNMGAYATLLESMSDEKRDLTVEEAAQAAIVGRSLRNRYSYGSKFSGRDDGYNSIQGLRHGGMAQEIRQQMTEFGSGWQGIKSKAMTAFNIATHDEVGFGLSTAGLYAYKKWEDPDSTLQDVALSSESFINTMFYAGSKTAKSIVGAPLFYSPLRGDPLAATVLSKYKMGGINEVLAMGGRTRNANRSGNILSGFGKSGIATKRRKRFGFGSPWQGLISMPKALAPYAQKTKFGAMGLYIPAGQFRNILDTFGGAIAKEEKGFLGKFFGKSRRAEARKGLEELRRNFIAVPTVADGTYVKKAFPGAILIDQSQVRNFDELKGVIAHERIHMKNAAPAARNKMKELEVPERFRAVLTGQETRVDRWNSSIYDWTRKHFGIGPISSREAYTGISEMSLKDEYLAYAAQNARVNAPARGDPLYENARNFMRDTSLTDINKTLAVQPASTKKKFWNPFGTRFSGRDDRSNTIEGLNHGGWAQKLRKFFTPFGSGFDILRSLTKGAESFPDMLKSKAFQSSLSSAKKGKLLGEGGFGKAFEMHGTFRGQDFTFVRKMGMIGKHEGAMMKKFGDDFAPSLYREGVGEGDTAFIDMEKLTGESLKSHGQKGTLTEDMMEEYEDILSKMHKQGMVHGDAALSNVMRTSEGNIGLIDFGGAGPVGTKFESHFPGVGIREHKIGRIDLDIQDLPEGATRSTVENIRFDKRLGKDVPEEVDAITFSERSYGMDAAYASEAWGSMLRTKGKLEARLQTADTIMELDTVMDSAKTAALTTEHRTKPIIAKKKLERAALQEETTKALWSNVTGGKNSRE